MAPKTDGEIAVVKPQYAVEEAYSMGYDRFEGVDADTEGDFDFAPFTDTSAWANIVLPSLRAMSGFADAGHGTYQEHRQVAAILPGDEEDEPAEAELYGAQSMLNVLVDAYRKGAYDAAEGAERSPPEPPYNL